MTVKRQVCRASRTFIASRMRKAKKFLLRPDGGAIFLDEVGDISPMIQLPPDFMSALGIEHRSADETQTVDARAILEALDKTAWNKAKAARLLGIDRVTLYRKIKRYNLTEDTP
jgi:transcriptional regulator with GAF, ATPase, and Fis domain